jgi:methylated-DNA-[protein]-cysteine S-methyltransferase
MKQSLVIKTNIGNLYLASENKNLILLTFQETWPYFQKKFSLPEAKKIIQCEVLNEAEEQISQYLEGKRKSFNIPINLFGTEFQKKAWNALTFIEYGKTLTYAKQAEAMQKPTAARAVGRANGLNPIAIILPCHRVVGASGLLTGYSGGIDTKRYLLNLESKN